MRDLQQHHHDHQQQTKVPYLPPSSDLLSWPAAAGDKLALAKEQQQQQAEAEAPFHFGLARCLTYAFRWLHPDREDWLNEEL